MRREKAHVDITGISFEDFVLFLFDRDIPAPDQSFAALAARNETDKWNPWYWSTSVTANAKTICNYYVQLFGEPGFLIGRFSRGQLEQGFWAIQTDNLGCSAKSIVWNTQLSFSSRAECIKAMFPLFRDLFATEALESSVCMWWDSFCYDWHCGNRRRSRGGEDMALQDVMFETLVDILALESDICQGAALHGLSHLHHPETEQAISWYLARNPSLKEDWKKIALGAARFELM